jgi:hypothetical protein
MIPFYCSPSYVNVGGVWEPCVVYVNDGGVWKPAHQQGNVSGTWKA